MEEILSFLKRDRHTRYAVRGVSSAQELQFMLLPDEQQQIYLQIVGPDLQPLDCIGRWYGGSVQRVVDYVEQVRLQQSTEISWQQLPERIYLKDHPQLLFLLLRSRRLVDREGSPITVSGDRVRLSLLLRRERTLFRSSFVLFMPEGMHSDFSLLSEQQVLVGNTIFSIDAVGEHFADIRYFEKDVPEQLLDRYLSLLYSHVENVELKFEDYQVVWSDTPVRSVPTVIFEKVDADNSLYLRVLHTLPDFDVDFLEEYFPSCVAAVTSDRQVLLRQVDYAHCGDIVDRLYHMIAAYAAGKFKKKDIYVENNFFVLSADVAASFLLRGLPALLKDYRLLGTDKLREYKLTAAQPRLQVALSSGIQFLEGDATVGIGDDRFALKDFFAQYRKQKYIQLSDGNRAVINEDYIRRLERIFRKDKGGQPYKVSFFDLPEVEELLGAPLEGEAFVHHREVYEGFNRLAEQKMSFAKVKADLRSYQQEGVKWINYLYENRLGGCLADDMGLGKTLQAIAMLARIYPKVKSPSLVVMPKSLLFNWQNEIARFAPQLTAYTYYGTERNLEEARRAQVILTTYAIVRNDIQAFSKAKFHYVILDESQNIKNVAAQVSQAVFLLQTEHRLALSGTPVENNLTELYSLFRFLNPTMFGSLEDFNSRYTYPVQRDGDKEVLASLRRKIFPFMLRRLKKDVLQELPERIEQTLYVEMEPEQAKYYEQRRTYYYELIQRNIAAEGIQKSQFVMFQALNELRRIASVPESMTDGQIVSPKLELLVDAVTETVENGHKVVIFFNYIAGIELVGERLDACGIDFASMTGSTHDRKGVVDRFQHDPKCRVLLMTLKTGGVGLNLTAADTVFIFEPWWNRAAEEQAVNRLHRFGQTSNVLSYSMVTKGTIEEKIRLLQEQKAELFAGLIGSDASSTKHLSEEDIRFILG